MKAKVIETFEEQIMNDIAEYAVDDIRHNRADTVEQAVLVNMNAMLIYDDDLWAIMKRYQRPTEANCDEAINAAFEELCEAIEVEDEFFEDEEEGE